MHFQFGRGTKIKLVDRPVGQGFQFMGEEYRLTEFHVEGNEFGPSLLTFRLRTLSLEEKAAERRNTWWMRLWMWLRRPVKFPIWSR